jgi:hypothetical protein
MFELFAEFVIEYHRKCPCSGNGLNKLWYIYTHKCKMEYFTAVKKKEVGLC